jgi:hypothetical protein
METLPATSQGIAWDIYVTIQQRIAVRSRLRSGVCSLAARRVLANHVLQLGAAVRAATESASADGILPEEGLQLLQAFYDSHHVPRSAASLALSTQ